MTKETVHIRFFCNNKMIHMKTTIFPPSIGDEVQLPGPGGKGAFFQVLSRLWSYDEKEHYAERLNIKVKLI